MTNREREVLDLIKKNPFISQDEIAKELNIARSSAAVHISNLMKKGYILGKGYIINEDDYVLAIGGANVDIQGFPKGKLCYRDSNIGTLRMSLGGVARNIAENLARLDVNVKLITAVGDDLYGKKIIEHSKKIGIDISNIIISSKESTSTYLSILDENGDMALAMSCMDICNIIDNEFIKMKKKLIENARLCVVDTNLPQETLEYLSQLQGVDMFLDTVSTSKAAKVKDFIGKFHTIKPNRLEAQVLTGININNVNDAKRACEYLLNKGVKNVFLTLGEEGVVFGNSNSIFKINMPSIKVVNATGAGDAFLAGLIFSNLNDMSIVDCVKFAISSAAITLSSKDTISDEMSVENVNKKMKEMELCLKNI